MGRRIASDPRLRELESIYNEHHGRVRWVLRGRGIAEDALDDLVHDVFIATFRRMKDRDPAVPMATWVAGVARNVAFSHRRASARRVAAAQRMPVPEESVGLDDEIARGQAWRELEAFLAGLDEDQREVFVLAECLGMRVPEVANVVDAPLNTLYSRLRIARRRFGDRFGVDAKEQLRRASAADRQPASQRQHAWMAISTTLFPKAAAPVGAAATTAVMSKWLIAGGVAIATLGAGVGLREVVRASVPAARVDGAKESAAAQPGGELGEGFDDRDASGASPTIAAPESDVVVDGVRPPAEAGATGVATGGSATQEERAAARSDRRPVNSTDEAPEPRARPDRARRPNPGDDRTQATAAEATKDPLNEAVEGLRDAQRQLKLGNPKRALQAMDGLSPQARGYMQRERHQIERQAACAIGDVARAGRAHKALVARGEVDSGDPCKKVPGP